MSFYLVSFGAGALLAAGFTDTLPEAIDGNPHALIFVTLFIVIFFIIERVFLSIHHHEPEEGEKHHRLPLSFLIFGDALHNFIDGLSIAATFLVSYELGIITTLAVFIHEIPHELGDFGIMLHLGIKRKRVVIFNLLTGVVAVIGAILGYFVGRDIEGALPILLSITSANFIYLSLGDLLPEVHEKAKGKTGIIHSLLFIAGVILVIALGMIIKE